MDGFSPLSFWRKSQITENQCKVLKKRTIYGCRHLIAIVSESLLICSLYLPAHLNFSWVRVLMPPYSGLVSSPCTGFLYDAYPHLRYYAFILNLAIVYLSPLEGKLSVLLTILSAFLTLSTRQYLFNKVRMNNFPQ